MPPEFKVGAVVVAPSGFRGVIVEIYHNGFKVKRVERPYPFTVMYSDDWDVLAQPSRFVML